MGERSAFDKPLMHSELCSPSRSDLCVGGDLVPQSPSLFVQMLYCLQDGPPSCLNITGCVELSRLRSLRNIYTLLVFRHPSDVLSPLCTIVVCTVSKNVPSR